MIPLVGYPYTALHLQCVRLYNLYRVRTVYYIKTLFFWGKGVLRRQTPFTSNFCCRPLAHTKLVFWNRWILLHTICSVDFFPLFWDLRASLCGMFGKGVVFAPTRLIKACVCQAWVPRSIPSAEPIGPKPKKQTVSPLIFFFLYKMRIFGTLFT